MTARSTSDTTQVIATLPSTVMAAAQRLKWNAIVVTSRAASRLGATGSDRVHRCPGSALRFLLLCLCTPFKTTGGLRTHRNSVEARQLAADFAEAPPESIRLEHLHRPAKGREKADRRLVRGKVEDDDAVTKSLHDLVPDKARERSGSLGVDAHLHEEVARTLARCGGTCAVWYQRSPSIKTRARRRPALSRRAAAATFRDARSSWGPSPRSAAGPWPPNARRASSSDSVRPVRSVRYPPSK